MFMPNLGRSITFEFSDSKKDDNTGFKQNNFYMSSDMFLNSTNTAENSVYNINIDGTTNLTSINRYPSFACKAHFYQMNLSMIYSSMPPIIDLKGNLTYPLRGHDESWIAVEPFSGFNMYTSLKM